METFLDRDQKLCRNKPAAKACIMHKAVVNLNQLFSATG
jgi:hypothetical protein